MKVDKNERTPYIMKTTRHFNDVSRGGRGASTRLLLAGGGQALLLAGTRLGSLQACDPYTRLSRVKLTPA